MYIPLKKLRIMVKSMDVFTKEQRSKIMSSIRSKETKLEKMIRKELWSRGIRYRKNVTGLFGSPDIAIKKYKVAIFIDSCFWHGCPIHYRRPCSNTDFWDKKIRKNILRDNIVTDYYIQNGWIILRFWEHDVKKNSSRIADEIIKMIRKRHSRKQRYNIWIKRLDGNEDNFVH